MARNRHIARRGPGWAQSGLIILLLFATAFLFLSLDYMFQGSASENSESRIYTRTSMNPQLKIEQALLEAPAEPLLEKGDYARIHNREIPSVTKGSRFRLNVENWRDVGKMGCHHFEAGPANKEYPDVLKKQAYSDKTRFVFILGIEGTGHHMFHSVLRECPTCTCPVGINGNADHGGFAVASYLHSHGVFGAKENKDGVNKHVSMFSKGLWKSIEEYYSDGGSRFNATDTATFFINSYKDEGETGRCTLWQDWSSYSELSYPNFGGSCRRWQIPDVRILAEMFESQGVDFRVVVLVRDGLDLLISNAIHRKWDRWNVIAPQYISILNENIIKSQLLRLDRNFFTCIDYDNLPDISDEVGKFLNIDNQQGSDWTLAKSFRKHFVDKRKDPTANDLKNRERSRYSQQDQAKYYQSLDTATRKLRSICNFD